MRDRAMKYWLVLPAVVAVLLSAVWPLLQAFYLSFRDWRLNQSADSAPLWTPADGWGDIAYLFDNYTRAFEDSNFWHSVWVTAVFSVSTVVITLGLSLACALLLFPQGRVRSVLRSLLILPFAMSPALIGINWRFMFNAEYGFVASLSKALGMTGPVPNWLGTPGGAMAIVASSDIWHWTPYITMMFIGALAAVPKDAQEAARIDGASSWQVFRDVTLPLIMPVIGLAAILKTIFALKVFDQIYLITNGGPGNSTSTLAYYIYTQGMKYSDMGYASALSYLLVIPLAVLVIIHTRTVFAKGQR
ncbi:carbohydrate ABC transporter permease [Amphibiibacter pelophylacis]|uniref:Sugar ABC transporter permease n=1 Tax=Amphibiibacter pelophylacis TaxID=1799477 RepID=A0ACC6P3K8_9BURK